MRCNSFVDGKCLGTKEIDVCSCNGDRLKCDFYSKIPTRQEARESMPDYKKNEKITQTLYEKEMQRIAVLISNRAANNINYVNIPFISRKDASFWEGELKRLGYDVDITYNHVEDFFSLRPELRVSWA